MYVNTLVLVHFRFFVLQINFIAIKYTLYYNNNLYYKKNYNYSYIVQFKKRRNYFIQIVFIFLSYLKRFYGDKYYVFLQVNCVIVVKGNSVKTGGTQ